jgi:hypothetical protein
VFDEIILAWHPFRHFLYFFCLNLFNVIGMNFLNQDQRIIGLQDLLIEGRLKNWLQSFLVAGNPLKDFHWDYRLGNITQT